MLTVLRKLSRTRPLDDAERCSLPLFRCFWQRQTGFRATGDKLFRAGIYESRCFRMTLRPRGFLGQLFDIVKIEERETWTARFLRTEAGSSDPVEVTKTFDGCTFSKRRLYAFALTYVGAESGVVSRQSCKRAFSDHVRFQT